MPAKGHRKKEHIKRSRQISFWATPAERDRIASNAERAGVSMSAYIRGLALGKEIRPKSKVETNKLIRSLSRIGNNMNQLVTHAEKHHLPSIEHIQHVNQRVSAALDVWARSKPKKPIPDDRIVQLDHAGSKLNSICRQLHLGKLVSEKEILACLNELTKRLRPFCL